MKMYIANTTQQSHHFEYRLPEKRQPVGIMIGAGNQVCLSNSMTSDEIAAVVEQHTIYGLVEAGTIARSTTKISLLYSVDKVISVNQIRAAYERNIGLMNDAGKEMRKQAAVVIGDALQANQPDDYKHVDIEVQEEADGAPRKVVENMHVSRREDGRGTAPSAPVRKAKKRAAG